MASRTAFLVLLLVGVVAACRAPAGGGSSSPSLEPVTPTPVAPAIEPDHPDAEQTIPLPTTPAPVAPAIETDHPDAERSIPLPSTAP